MTRYETIKPADASSLLFLFIQTVDPSSMDSEEKEKEKAAAAVAVAATPAPSQQQHTSKAKHAPPRFTNFKEE